MTTSNTAVPVTGATATQQQQRLSVAEAAAKIGCSVQTIYRMLAEGTLPRRKIRHRTYIPAAAVDAFLEEVDPNA